MNRVIMMGRLTHDPELRYTTGKGKPVCNFTVALNESWKDEQGVKKEKVTFVNCTAWAGSAEVIGKHCKKGSRLLVEGKLHTEEYEDTRGGEERTISKLAVTVENFQFADSKKPDSK
jgi:single-strand DNA-binding protein